MSEANPAAFHSRSFAPDADAVEARFREHWGDHRVTSAHATMRDDIVGTPRFFLSRTEISGSLDTNSVNDVLSVAVATGVFTWESKKEAGDGTLVPFMPLPGQPLVVQHRDVVVEAVSFEAAAFQRTARIAFGDERLQLRFDSSLPFPGRWQRIMESSVRMAVADSALVLESDLVATALHRYLAACVLECFPIQGDPIARQQSTRAQESGYRRARVFIGDYASLPITVDDIAEAAGLTPKQLDAAFRWHSATGGSVKDELRRVRLDAAHRDLVAGDPTLGDTVHAIALRWGFTPSRFAAAYRLTYGVNPKWVLDR